MTETNWDDVKEIAEKNSRWKMHVITDEDEEEGTKIIFNIPTGIIALSIPEAVQLYIGLWRALEENIPKIAEMISD